MDIDELSVEDYGFREFISANVKAAVDELIIRFGVAPVASNYEKIRVMFEDELNKYLK